MSSTASPVGQWSVKNCTVFKAGSICKRLVTAGAPAPTPAEPDLNATCPPGWVSAEGIRYCYKVGVGFSALVIITHLLYTPSCMCARTGLPRGAVESEALMGRG